MAYLEFYDPSVPAQVHLFKILCQEYFDKQVLHSSGRVEPCYIQMHKCLS